MPIRDTNDCELDQLADFLVRHSLLFVLSGAGCSTGSGIPDYRDAAGDWKRQPPVTLQAFLGTASTRARYWARSLVGWRRFGHAVPNAAHVSLARLEVDGRIEVLLTQNVDGLHQASGSSAVIDLHGRLDRVRCLSCGQQVSREALQHELEDRNPAWRRVDAQAAPDGDADIDEIVLADMDPTRFDVPDCAACGGMLKPDVVFFGENVPRERVERAGQHLAAADAMLVVGSSLMVWSGYRFAVAAARAGKPIAAINIGRTRADHLFEIKVESDCADALASVVDRRAVAAATAASN